MTQRFLPLILIFFMFACSGEKKAHEKLNGTWESKVMTVSFDFSKEKYSGISLGQAFDKKLTLVSEQGNAVVFKSNDTQITAQIQEDGSVILMKEGGIPIVLKRAK